MIATMTLHEFILDLLIAAAGVVAASPLVKLLRMGETLVSINMTIGKAFNVIGAQRVSDHLKERVLPHYALEIFIGSGHLAVYLLVILGAFVLGISIAQLMLLETLDGVLDRVSRWQFQSVAAVLGGIIYIFLRLRRR